MKTLTDIEQDMSALYDRLSEGKVELKLASELANIAGKNLKAKQLRLAEDIFRSGKRFGPHIDEEAARAPFPTFPSASQLIGNADGPASRKRA